MSMAIKARLAAIDGRNDLDTLALKIRGDWVDCQWIDLHGDTVKVLTRAGGIQLAYYEEIEDLSFSPAEALAVSENQLQSAAV